MDVYVTDDLFPVSFGIIRQLRNDLPCHWGQQNHSYSPIWASERVRTSPEAGWLEDYWIVS